jgi:hypothetical protein
VEYGGVRYYSKLTIDILSVEADPTFIYYPNPASEVINLEFSNGARVKRNIAVSDMIGRSLIHVASAAKEVQLDVSSLQPGCYIITVNENGRRIAQKLIIN